MHKIVTCNTKIWRPENGDLKFATFFFHFWANFIVRNNHTNSNSKYLARCLTHMSGILWPHPGSYNNIVSSQRCLEQEVQMFVKIVIKPIRRKEKMPLLRNFLTGTRYSWYWLDWLNLALTCLLNHNTQTHVHFYKHTYIVYTHISAAKKLLESNILWSVFKAPFEYVSIVTDLQSIFDSQSSGSDWVSRSLDRTTNTCLLVLPIVWCYK